MREKRTKRGYPTGEAREVAEGEQGPPSGAESEPVRGIRRYPKVGDR